MIPERHAPTAYALFRIVFGFLFGFHGAQKLLGAFGGIDGDGAAAPLVGMYGAAGTIELLCGLLVMIGLFTRPAAFVASGLMAAAYFTAHQPVALWPVQNAGELAALYAFGFLYMAARGSGMLSVDAARTRV